MEESRGTGKGREMGDRISRNSLKERKREKKNKEKEWVKEKKLKREWKEKRLDAEVVDGRRKSMSRLTRRV